MTPREVRTQRKLREDLGLAERRRNDLALIDRLEGDIVRVDQQQRGVTEEFKATYASWNAEPAPADMLPYARVEDTAIARSYRMAAIVALLAEVVIAAWLSWRREINPLVGAGFAVAVTVVSEWCLHFTLYGPSGQRRPKVALRQLKRVAFYPAFACFCFAVLTTILGRTVEGPLAASDWVLALVTNGLFLLTLGLVFLAAALRTAAFIYKWSARLAERFYALDADSRSSRALLAEVRRDTPPPAPEIVSVTEVRSDEVTQSRSTVASIARSLPSSVAGALVLFLLTLGATACTGHAAPADVQVVAVSDAARPSCNTVLDTSGSVARLGLVWSQVRRELPDLVIRMNCASLRVSTFDVDGWTWKPVVEIAIPQARLAEAAHVPAELGGAKNFKDAIEAKQLGLAVAARRAHKELVVGLLRKLDVVDEYLRSVSSTAGSDPIGVLRRVARTPAANEIFVIVTDMADTGLGSLHVTLPTPGGSAQVLVLLAPANARDAAYVGAPAGSADQFENRAKLVRGMASWAVVEPYFATGYADLLEHRPATAAAGGR